MSLHILLGALLGAQPRFHKTRGQKSRLRKELEGVPRVVRTCPGEHARDAPIEALQDRIPPPLGWLA